MTVIPLRQRGFGETMRRDAWWGQPLLTLVVLGGFVVYATWAALQGDHYEYGPYLSPFYSPLLFGEGPHSWFGPLARPGWWPGALPFSAAILILWAPGGFRFTCYYYRGAYYKAFWADPPSCAVGEPRKGYRGENSFPLILQNVHRYFLYLALAFLFVLAWDVWKAMWFTNPATGQESFGIGVGTLVLAAERGVPLQLHARLSLVPAPGRRPARPVLPAPDPGEAVRRIVPAQLQSHAMGVGQSLLRRAV